ncbi:MAG: polyketide synthase, partial [Acidobacteria bacterium]|nr:polyketide synthase [Acidobacteriota bacterium]
MSNSNVLDNFDGSEIAIIGMAGRFPKSKNIDEFWRNIRDGVECITFLTDEELEFSNIDPAARNHPNYVKAASILDDVELFDAPFFGYTPREAEVMDPQQRLFLECAWQALENAGYDSERFHGDIGVYAGARTNTYLFNLYSNQEALGGLGSFQVGLGNDLAFLSTRVSYKMNLKGPAYSVHTACSTSLVAIHLACQSLLIDECQMALAGGVSVNVPHRTGYIYQHGDIVSPDGHCRAFDAAAQGTIFGSGVGVVVLKRLEDALRDRDSIHA